MASTLQSLLQSLLGYLDSLHSHDAFLSTSREKSGSFEHEHGHAHTGRLRQPNREERGAARLGTTRDRGTSNSSSNNSSSSTGINMEEQKHTRFDVWIAAGLLRMQALLGSLPGADDARRVLSGNPPSSYAHDSFHNASVKRGDIILTATPGYTASAARALAGVTHDHVVSFVFCILVVLCVDL